MPVSSPSSSLPDLVRLARRSMGVLDLGETPRAHADAFPYVPNIFGPDTSLERWRDMPIISDSDNESDSGSLSLADTVPMSITSGSSGAFSDSDEDDHSAVPSSGAGELVIGLGFHHLQSQSPKIDVSGVAGPSNASSAVPDVAHWNVQEGESRSPYRRLLLAESASRSPQHEFPPISSVTVGNNITPVRGVRRRRPALRRPYCVVCAPPEVLSTWPRRSDGVVVAPHEFRGLNLRVPPPGERFNRPEDLVLYMPRLIARDVRCQCVRARRGGTSVAPSSSESDNEFSSSGAGPSNSKRERLH